MCFDFLYSFCLKHFSLNEEFCEMLSLMYVRLHVNYPLFLLDFNEKFIFINKFLKNVQISSFMKTPPVGAELFHAD
jgi:hypothetical protein